MRRREFIAGFGGAVAWPFAARAQRAALPVIGYLGTGTAGSTGIDLDGFRQGLADAGFVDGRNLTIKYRWAEGAEPTYEMTVYGHSPRGQALAAWEIGIKPIIRTVRDRIVKITSSPERKENAAVSDK